MDEEYSWMLTMVVSLILGIVIGSVWFYFSTMDYRLCKENNGIYYDANDEIVLCGKKNYKPLNYSSGSLNEFEIEYFAINKKRR